MSLEVIYVIRHAFRSGFTVDPVTGTYATTIYSPTKIPTDPPLTSYGVDQATEAALHLLKLDPPIDQVYSSPYYRCLQTIAPFVAKRNETSAGEKAATPVLSSDEHLATIRVERGLSEWFGLAPWEHPSPAPLSKLQELFPAIDPAYVSAVETPRNGESLSQLHDRVAAAIDAIVLQSDKEGKKAVVVCTHAAAVIALGRVLTGRMPDAIDEEDFAAYTCGLSIYRRRKAAHEVPAVSIDRHTSATVAATPRVQWMDGQGVRGGWVCEADSDCSFLRGGAERGWRFSGDESFSAIGSQTLAGSSAVLGVDLDAPNQNKDGRKHCKTIFQDRGLDTS
ncbi:histidine phosphatase superfamily [Xylariales sp. PMI_506]|nr:histidine phosphatase superfamily [Xylariales sp. PMI_506]